MDKKNYLIIGIIIVVLLFSFFKTSEEECVENIIYIEEPKTENVISKIKVHITGAVKKQGIIELDEGARISDAIDGAEGVTEEANLNSVNLAYELSDGQKIYIPKINENEEEYISEEAGENVLEEENIISGKININKADLSDLQTISGIGESLAKRIIDYREKNGKFKEIDELKNVSGIGEKKFEDIKDKIVIK